MIGNAFRSFIHAAVPGNGRDWQGRVLLARPYPPLLRDSKWGVRDFGGLAA